MTRRTAVVLALGAVVCGVVSFLVLRSSEAVFTFTQDDLQKRVAEKFPFDQTLLVFTVTYSNPVVTMKEGSDRIGFGFDATAKLGEGRLAKGRVAGDWQLRYDPTEGGIFFDDPQINQFDIQGLPASAQATVDSVARPLVQEVLKRVPVYRLKPGDVRQDLARSALKSVSVKNGRLVVVIGAR